MLKIKRLRCNVSVESSSRDGQVRWGANWLKKKQNFCLRCAHREYKQQLWQSEKQRCILNRYIFSKGEKNRERERGREKERERERGSKIVALRSRRQLLKTTFVCWICAQASAGSIKATAAKQQQQL